MHVKLFLSILGLTGTTPGNQQISSDSGPYSCSIYQTALEGTWRASRDIAMTGRVAKSTRDTYEWESNEIVQFADGMKLRWSVVYYWPTDIASQRNISETEMMVDMHFAFEAKNGATFKKPERSWLNFYRSADTGRDRHALATSLSTMTLWHQYGSQRLSTRAILSLDDLLAFGTGHDSLRWEIRSPPDAFGRMDMVAKGHLPIAAMRGKGAEILRLRKLLDKKAANFRKQCDLVPRVPISAPS